MDAPTIARSSDPVAQPVVRVEDLNHFFGEGACLIGVARGPSNVEPDIVALPPTKVLKPALKRGYAGLSFTIAFAILAQYANSPNLLTLLRLHCKRPGGRRPTKEADELAPSHVASEVRTKRNPSND